MINHMHRSAHPSNQVLQANAQKWRALLEEAPEKHVFKEDQRSRVWQVEGPNGPLVVKRFEYAPLRQSIAALLGQHPAQREVRANRMLQNLRVQVVPIVAFGRQRATIGIRYWLATPKYGQSLDKLLVGPSHLDRTITDAVANLVQKLQTTRIFFKDLKTSNILIDHDGQAWLIDVGSARTARSNQHLPRMLAMLDRTARRDGASRTVRLRCLQSILGPRSGRHQIKQAARQVAEING